MSEYGNTNHKAGFNHRKMYIFAMAPAVTERFGQGWSRWRFCACGALWIFWLWGVYAT